MFGEGSQNCVRAFAFLPQNVVNDQTVLPQLVFVLGKACVAPLKALTIQKLEQQTTLLGLQLRAEVLRALTMQIDNTFMQTNNTTSSSSYRLVKNSLCFLRTP